MRLPFTLPFLRESTCIRSSSALVAFPTDTVGFAPKFREYYNHCNKAVRRAALLAYVTQLQTVPKKSGCHIHHHCIFDCICQRSSRSTPEFRRHHDLVHQSVRSILSGWRICCVSDAMPLLRWIPQQIGQEFGHCRSLSRPTNSTSACSTSGVHRPAISLLPGKSDSARLRTRPSTVERL